MELGRHSSEQLLKEYTAHQQAQGREEGRKEGGR